MSSKVRIVYCAECGYEPQALELARALMVQRQAEFSSIEFVPWMDGTFEVWVDRELVHSMGRDGGFPIPDTVIDALRQSGGQTAKEGAIS
jgi:selenoprotein W-related protein